MKIVFDPSNMLSHLEEVKKEIDSVRSARRVHRICIPLALIPFNFILCFLTGKVLLPSCLSIFLMFLLPKILFFFLPSCQLPVYPTPKMLFYEATRDGKVVDMEIEENGNLCFITIFSENKNGETEERKTVMCTEKREDLEEDIMDFEQNVFFISGKEPEGDIEIKF